MGINELSDNNSVQHIKISDCVSTPWSRVRGNVTELAKELIPESNRNLWRIAIISIGQNDYLSIFENITRYFILFAGNGMRLQSTIGRNYSLIDNFTAYQIEGELIFSHTLIDGPVKYLSLLVDRALTKTKVDIKTISREPVEIHRHCYKTLLHVPENMPDVTILYDGKENQLAEMDTLIIDNAKSSIYIKSTSEDISSPFPIIVCFIDLQ